MLSEIIIKYISLFFHKINKEDLRLFLEASPHYPNLLSVVQTLQYFNLDTHVGQCDWNYLKKISSPFLLHIKIKKQEALIIAKWEEHSSILKVFNLKNNKWEIKSMEDLGSVWNGIVIYSYKNVKRNRFLKCKILPYLGAIIIVLITGIIHIQSEISFLYAFPIVMGWILSLYIFYRRYINRINFFEKICNKFSITDCEAVENSSFGLWRGISLGNMSLSFFISQLICVIVSGILGVKSVLYTMYSIGALVFIPITLYSVISQIKLEKICPLCLMILICVFVEMLLFINIPAQPLNWEFLIVWGIINTCILCLLHFYSIIYFSRQELLKTKIQLMKLKRKRDVILLESSHVNPIMTPIYLGKKISKTNITTIISPSCKHCRKVAFELLALIDRGFEFRWNIILGKRIEADLENNKYWVNEYIYNKNKFVHDLYLWSSEKKQSLYCFPQPDDQNKQITEICQIFNRYIDRLDISGFPQIILNDRWLSPIYTIKDIEFIIKDITDFSQ